MLTTPHTNTQYQLIANTNLAYDFDDKIKIFDRFSLLNHNIIIVLHLEIDLF